MAEGLLLDALALEQGAFRLRADLEVRPGAVVAVMGPSGGGKSTLLAAVAGFVAPAAGRVLWDGRDLGDLPPGRRPVSVLFQDNNLFPHLTVAQNVGLGLRPALRLTAPERARVEDALARVGLGGLGCRRPAALSGGQAGRAALARVLLEAQPLVLLDEPFAALGPAQRAEMLDLTVAALGARGATLLMVTHEPRDAARSGGGRTGGGRAGGVIVVDGGVAAPPVPWEAAAEALRGYLGEGVRPSRPPGA